MRVLSITRPYRKRHYEVALDEGGLLTLSPDVYALSGLSTGAEVSPARIAELREGEARHRAMSRALRLLSHRQRSERELRDALRRQGTSEPILAETLSRLRELGLVDDARFAESYVETRSQSSPRGRRLLAVELALKGIGKTERDRSVATVDDSQAAYVAAQKRARSLGNPTDFVAFQRKLGDYLLRRGFTYETSRDTVRRLWEETRPGVSAGPLEG